MMLSCIIIIYDHGRHIIICILIKFKYNNRQKYETQTYRIQKTWIQAFIKLYTDTRMFRPHLSSPVLSCKRQLYNSWKFTLPQNLQGHYVIHIYILSNILLRIINLATRIVTKSNSDHITPILESLHWLPIDSRFRCEVLLFTLMTLFPPISDCSKLSKISRYASQKILKFPGTRRIYICDRISSEWKKLPLSLQ